ncbi:putative DEAD/DEAH box helicase [Monocercomonoides exilis]|uniref:putative DEAD/DEAH box helicase n=1 Tax=Monocercomonoides exilis TaxID=2049356 RepID=UPI003559A170|nr:putative DEAD/DEAH box helicase [Monocercomonoides exilis]|eukprot:MONOS_2693.1-p1 / transcript=MONOS_2693.1 / gene=MONOS_2693 / organism=Monocercomonoides_exilis_PA203 / gene_product=DEAD/DEAH box helicase / transcript_product=DEAD/DEAH box helicase / location=Mono_scaffold00056:155278-156049(+) / protein_length=181 / sequence_SO=supercontig / SO=protein_coding / is_pseudo=false
MHTTLEYDEQKFPQFIPLQQKKQSNWIDDDIFSPKADSKVEEPAPQKLLPFFQRLPALSSSVIRSLRNDQKIHVDGSSIPTPIRIVFPAFLSGILAVNRFETPTLIQMQGISVLMTEKNLIAVAPTGSGKTAAYLLRIISSIIEMRTQKKTEKELNIHPLRAVIISPTREIERQVLETAD